VPRALQNYAKGRRLLPLVHVRDGRMSFEKKAHKSGFADVFVARPIFGIVLNLLIIIAGLARFPASTFAKCQT